MHDQDLKFFYGTLFGRRENKHKMMIFFIPSSNVGSVPKDSTPVKFSYSFAVFSKLEKTQKFEKTRIRLNSDVFATLAINILKHPVPVRSLCLLPSKFTLFFSVFVTFSRFLSRPFSIILTHLMGTEALPLPPRPIPSPPPPPYPFP